MAEPARVRYTPPSRTPKSRSLRVVEVVLVGDDDRAVRFPVSPPKRLDVPAKGLRIFVIGDRAYLQTEG